MIWCSTFFKKAFFCFSFIFAFISSILVHASSISEFKTYGNFETVGVIIKVDSMNFNESAVLEYKSAGDATFKRGHDFVRFDGNHMASSIFKLSLNTSYDIRVTLYDPDGVTGANPYETNVRTKAEFSIPAPLRVVNVSGQTELDDAISNLQPGDEIRLTDGTYPDGIHIYLVSGTSGNPIVFTSQGANKPIILGNSDAGICIEGGSYFIINNLEVHNELGSGIYFRGCHNMVISNCYVHDNQPGDYTANISIQHGEEATPPFTGNFLILNNVIGDDVHDVVDENQGPGESNTNVPGQCYFGIDCRYNPGPFITVRNNKIYGVVDGIHPCADEGGDPVIGPDDMDLLNTWVDRELDLYDNVFYDCKDDDIELDGHMVNGRVFSNRLGKCENAISVAPIYAGPIFIIRNYICGFHQGSLKQNVDEPGITRGVLFYHNTVAEKLRTNPPHCENEYCLYRGEPAQQQNFVYKNNIFFARGRVYNGDMYSGGYHLKDTFDFNLMYSTRESPCATPNVFKWVSINSDTLNNTGYEDLNSFQTATGQEPHGIWGDPKLDTSLISGYPSNSYIENLEFNSSSPAIDAGVLILGINYDFKGNGPDIGAYESEFTGVPEDNESVSSPIKLVEISPNPFSNSIEIIISSSTAEKLFIDIYDIKGDLVKTVQDFSRNGKLFKIVWDGKDNFGSKVASGEYIMNVRQGNYSLAGKLYLLR